MQNYHSCTTTDRLCIEYNQVELEKPIEVFWPVGMVPVISDLSKLKIYIYQSDLLRQPQSDPCHIEGLNALYSWTPLVLSAQNQNFPLLKSTSITIPASPEILSAISSDNNFFLQIRSEDDQLCSIGPYVIPNPFTSFKLLLPNGVSPPGGSNSTNNGTSPTPTNPPDKVSDPISSLSLTDRTDLQIGLGVCIGIILILIIGIATILQRKVKLNNQKMRELQLKEDISKLCVALGSEFAVSNDSLLRNLVSTSEDRHEIVVVESEQSQL